METRLSQIAKNKRFRFKQNGDSYDPNHLGKLSFLSKNDGDLFKTNSKKKDYFFKQGGNPFKSNS